LKPRQRVVPIETVPDAANLAAGSMFFAQFLTDRPFSVILGLIGITAWIAFWVFTLLLAEEEQ
jgi:hypothetical protein